jgi:MerR family transcriptional regulator, redox-sensitive transcriptional activator SoxR
MRGHELITIGDLADRTGLSVSAIRYYETQQLVAPERNRGGQRRFLRADIRRLSFVVIAQQLGFTIKDIRAFLAPLPEGRVPNKADWHKISQKMRKDLDERIAILGRLRANLDGCIGCGCLSLQKCKLYNPDDRARRMGQGARYVLSDRRES